MKKLLFNALFVIALLSGFVFADCNGTLNSSCCAHNLNTTVHGSITKAYAYNSAGNEIVNGLSIVNFIILSVYLALLLFSILKGVFDKTGKRFK